jgi:hypothetical protein
MRETAGSAAAPGGQMQKLSAGKFQFEPPFTSFDHLVGKREQSIRHVETKHLCRREIDHQLELGRLQYRHLGGLLALENAAGIDADVTIRISVAGTLAHQAARSGIIPQRINRGNGMSRCQRNDLVTPAEEKGTALGNESIGTLLDEAGKRGIDLARIARFHHAKLHPGAAGRLLQVHRR